MKNQPGYSWGVEAHVNLVESENNTYLAIYCEDDKSIPEVIREFKPQNYAEKLEMFSILGFYNYNTCKLCPIVKAEIDATC